MDIPVRKKHEILETLADAINDSDRKTAKDVFICSGSLLKNKYKTKDNPASFVGWARSENQDLIRVEGEPRERGGQINLALKLITIPNEMAVELGLDAPNIPAYTKQSREKESQSDFFNQD